jgi:hypothetical protein
MQGPPQEEVADASGVVPPATTAAMVNEPTVPPLPEYLALRQQKIERNLSRLRQLGLLTPAKESTAASSPGSRSSTPGSGRKRKPAAAVLDETSGTASAGLRRSGRLRTTTPNPNDSSRAKQEAAAAAESVQDDSNADQPEPSSRGGPIQKPLPSKSTTKPPVVLDATRAISNKSALSIALDTTKVIDTFLGLQMANTGKAHVMNECSRLCSNGGGGPDVVSFNKYSGVQEWGNDVFFLWINLDAPRSTVVNAFHNGTIGWYGGSRHHDGSPVIARLKVASTVLLWCRKYQDNDKTFGPYSLLGRLSVRVDGNVTPERFVY